MPCNIWIFHWFCFPKTYPDFDGWTVCNAQPVTVWRKAQCIDAVIMVQSVQMFAIVQVPQQGFGIFTARCAMNRLAKRWQCSSSRCVLCGWSWVCNWPNSRPWRYDPNRTKRWLDCCGLARIGRTTPNRSDPHLELCTCIRQVCSTIWWSCPGIQRRFDDCQHWMQPTTHPIQLKTEAKRKVELVNEHKELVWKTK